MNMNMNMNVNVRPLLFSFLVVFGLFIHSCDDGFDGDVQVPDFNFPQTDNFNPVLSSYGIFSGNMQQLTPNDDYHLLELSSVLYTDYAYKQRLIKVPEGTQLSRLNDGSLEFPDGTILVKTFFYFDDERDTSLGKRIIETRLLTKVANEWNVATYAWNDAQNEATLLLEGSDLQVNWINGNGSNISTLYHIPDENECIACHQSDESMVPLGTSLRNINRNVFRNGADVNQIEHLQSVGVLESFSTSQVSQIVDYKDVSIALSQRARAYMAMNCAHCHNPDGWEESAEEDLDFRYETPLAQTGILDEEEEIIELITEGEMPFLGTTIIDQEGVDLIIEYIESL